MRTSNKNSRLSERLSAEKKSNEISNLKFQISKIMGLGVLMFEFIFTMSIKEAMCQSEYE